ncbi:MAG TPA: nickel pincer cofactor biosynthesis protein LarB [Thermoanaerobaculia bacterium]|nr:nickel pincer cofactor biosynthesis protein LarB [Thermoanaerobaculia bacterium]
MNPRDLQQLLEAVAAGEVTPSQAQERLAELPFADLGFANLDLHRELRLGLPEAVYAEGKTSADLRRIVDRLLAAHGRVLVTRLAPAAAAELQAGIGRGTEGAESSGGAVYHERARVLTCGTPAAGGGVGVPSGPPIAVLAAGTSDLPVAEEAAVCAEWCGHPVNRAYDVGVAGLHRLLGRLPEIRSAGVVIAVAGMDGALPTVVASLVPAPVVAVPTSVGYGASFGGLAPLLTMLNGCAPGVGVVNIDNGYGAAILASRIARLAQRSGSVAAAAADEGKAVPASPRG